MNSPLLQVEYLGTAIALNNTKTPGIYSPDEALEYLQEENSLNIEQIRFLYDTLSVHTREGFLARVAKDMSVSPLRKSMLFQVAHYIDHDQSDDEISLRMALWIYYGLSQETPSIEAQRLWNRFIRKWLSETAPLESWINKWLSGEPWRFSWNERKRILTSLKVFFRVMPNSESQDEK